MTEPGELSRIVENLALRVVVDSDAGSGTPDIASWLEAVRQLEQAADRNGVSALAVAAAAVCTSIGSALQEGATSRAWSELHEGIATFQQVLDTGAAPTGQPEYSPAQDPELLSDFVLESRDHLSSIESQVLTLERDPSNSEAIHSIFRGFHTIKGLAGFLELSAIQELAHEVEAVLDRARNGQLLITPASIDVILQSTDYLRRWLAHVECILGRQPSEPPSRDQRLLERIRACPDTVASPETGLSMLVAAVSGPGSLREPAALPMPAPAPASPPRRAESMAVKVDTAKLDSLVDMAGELVIAESLIRHDPDLIALKSPRLQRNIVQLTRITAEVQKTAMAMRLVPIGPLFRRMARLVRDLSRQCGKTVEMQTVGDEIELDRTIVEELADPLMHMVRNAIDHGIESPEARAASGKDPAATICLKAHHQAGQVVIEIADDGRGLDREKILAKAIERGLARPGESRSDAEVYSLVFEPGFSTAQQVTNVSGRGVGMDVVRRHIEKLRGRIEIRSDPGRGAAFILKLPLTLAIIDGLVVSVGPERYIVPLFAVRELFRPGADCLWTVEGRAEMALVRGALLPVLRLYQRFGIQPRSTDPAQSVLVVSETEGRRFCLLVDDLVGKQEVVIKSLGPTFASVPGLAGGAILGDGRVGLILDLERLYQEGRN